MVVRCQAPKLKWGTPPKTCLTCGRIAVKPWTQQKAMAPIVAVHSGCHVRHLQHLCPDSKRLLTRTEDTSTVLVLMVACSASTAEIVCDASLPVPYAVFSTASRQRSALSPTGGATTLATTTFYSTKCIVYMTRCCIAASGEGTFTVTE